MLHSVMLFALLAALAHCLFSIANRIFMTRGTLGALPATLLMQTATGGIALPFLLLGRVAPVPAALPFILAVAIISTVGFVMIMASFAREDASAVGPILGLKVIYLALLEPLVDHTTPSLYVLLAAAVSMLGVALVSQRDRWSLHPRDLLRPGVSLMAVAALLFAVCDLFVKHALAAWGQNSWAVNLYLITAMALVSVLGLVIIAAVRRRWPRMTLGGWSWPALRPVLGWLLTSSVAIFLMQFFFFTSFALGHNVTLTNILYNVRGLLLVALGAFLVLGRGSTVERAGPRAYLFRGAGALLTLGAIALALITRR